MQSWLSWSERGTVLFHVVGSNPTKTEKSNLHGFGLHRPSIKGTKLLVKVTKTIMIINGLTFENGYLTRNSFFVDDTPELVEILKNSAQSFLSTIE